ncbi:uncharacterized protein LOC143188467 [Calliopsis andreniformis]|uniref:uncharacterized protein LOC143188467 n=1 Tax=Calliopsis andreniformis TaxID=337506 RepID=UPI003FCC519E
MAGRSKKGAALEEKGSLRGRKLQGQAAKLPARSAGPGSSRRNGKPPSCRDEERRKRQKKPGEETGRLLGRERRKRWRDREGIIAYLSEQVCRSGRRRRGTRNSAGKVIRRRSTANPTNKLHPWARR